MTMWRKVLMVCMAALFLQCHEAYGVQYAYRIAFANKNGTPHSISTPLTYLSPRALDRRTAHGIAIDSTDLPVSPAYLDSVLRLTGGKFHSSSRWFNLCVILLSDSSRIHALDTVSFVVNIRLVGYYSGTLHRTLPANTGGSIVPAGTALKTSAGDATYYGTTWDQTSLVNGPYLHTNGYTGTGKLIAVMDAGFLSADTHPGLDSMRRTGRLTDTYNFVLDTNSVFDYDNHGTKALSTMAGYIAGTYVGTAPHAAYALYVTEDNNTEQPVELLNMLSATERADSIGADIISSSLGYNTFDNPADDFDFATQFDGRTTIAAAAANMATRKGMLFVTSAGNEGGGPWNKILTPGDADSALTIGSADRAGSPAYNSGYGPNAAGRIKPEVCLMGNPASVFSNTGYTAESGTSFSTPQAAGWAACLWQASPRATPFQLRQAIVKCASIYNSPDDHLGYGVPDFQCTAGILMVYDTLRPYDPAKWITAAPNPFPGEVVFYVSPDTDQQITFTLTDMGGRTVVAETLALSKGYNLPVTLTMPLLPAGLYVLRAVSATRQQVIKLQKL